MIKAHYDSNRIISFLKEVHKILMIENKCSLSTYPNCLEFDRYLMPFKLKVSFIRIHT